MPSSGFGRFKDKTRNPHSDDDYRFCLNYISDNLPGFKGVYEKRFPHYPSESDPKKQEIIPLVWYLRQWRMLIGGYDEDSLTKYKDFMGNFILNPSVSVAWNRLQHIMQSNKSHKVIDIDIYMAKFLEKMRSGDSGHSCDFDLGYYSIFIPFIFRDEDEEEGKFRQLKIEKNIITQQYSNEGPSLGKVYWLQLSQSNEDKADCQPIPNMDEYQKYGYFYQELSFKKNFDRAYAWLWTNKDFRVRRNFNNLCATCNKNQTCEPKSFF